VIKATLLVEFLHTINRMQCDGIAMASFWIWNRKTPVEESISIWQQMYFDVIFKWREAEEDIYKNAVLPQEKDSSYGDKSLRSSTCTVAVNN
jgi:hypothetical protein